MNSPSSKLLEAAQFGDSTLARRAIREGANLNRMYRGRTALHWAVQEGHVSVVRYLTKAGALLDKCDEDGISPLQQAAGEGHLSILKALIEGGANLNKRSRDGSTPLHIACAYGHKACVQLLLASGAVTDIQDKHNRTPTYYAALYGRKGLIQLIAKYTNGRVSNKRSERRKGRKRK